MLKTRRVKQLPKIFCKMPSLKFSIKLDHILWMITNLIAFSIFLPTSGYARRFDRILKQGIKIQKNGKPSHCAIICGQVTGKWQTMLPKEVFIFFGRENHFLFFECPKGGFFVKDLPNNCCKIGPNQFYKILGHI